MPLRLRYDNARGACDLDTRDGDTVLDAVETAVLLTLLSDARADDELVEGDHRGYWGDAFDGELDAPDPPGPLGSRLWVVLEQGVVDERAARRLEAASREALRWLVDGGYARTVEPLAEAAGDRINLDVTVVVRDGRRVRVTVPLVTEAA